MTDSFIDEKNDGACLPCEMPKQPLLSKLEKIDEFKPILAKFFEEFERTKDNFVPEEDKAVIYDKYDDRYHTVNIPLSEREQIAREDLCRDDKGWFDEIITDSGLTEQLVEFFRNLAKEKFM